MNNQEAAGVLSLLADGIDPATGEEFPSDSPYQNPRVIRALFCAIRALQGDPPPASSRRSPPKQPPVKRSPPVNAGMNWSPGEEAKLLEGYDAGASMAALARAHERTVGAIRARLVLLGRLQADGSPNPPPSPSDRVDPV